MEKVRAYYWLTKPGIVYSNVIAAAAGFLLASGLDLDLSQLAILVVGSSLVVASACVFNNYLDLGIDIKMARTQKRALVSGTISGTNALLYGVVLGVVGAYLLSLTNELALLLAMFGVFMYVIVYGIGKRKTVHGTVIGSVSGAIPPVIGYAAASGQLDTAALLLFLILTFWQMPHFYAIAMFRRDDYAAAGVPVLPIVSGMQRTKLEILWYIAAFAVAAILLAVFGYAGYVYAIVMGYISAKWLIKGWRGFNTADDVQWARQMFGYSLTVLLVFCGLISLEALLP